MFNVDYTILHVQYIVQDIILYMYIHCVLMRVFCSYMYIHQSCLIYNCLICMCLQLGCMIYTYITNYELVHNIITHDNINCRIYMYMYI